MVFCFVLEFQWEWCARVHSWVRMSWETPLWWCVVANLLGNYLDASSVVKEDKMHCWSWFSYAEIMEFCLNRWLWDLDLTVLGSSFCVWSFFFFSCYYQTFPLRLIIQLSFSPIGRKGGIHWIRVARCLNCLFFSLMGRVDCNFQLFSVEPVLVMVCTWRKKALIPFPPKKSYIASLRFTR